MNEITVKEAFQKGINLHRAGNLSKVEKYYTTILSAQPNHVHANHNLGLIACSFNKVDLSLNYFKKAIDCKLNTLEAE